MIISKIYKTGEGVNEISIVLQILYIFKVNCNDLSNTGKEGRNISKERGNKGHTKELKDRGDKLKVAIW